MKWELLPCFLTIAAVLGDEYITSKDWLLRPGPIHVCEGDTAHFRWNYNHSFGDFQSFVFLKHFPNWVILFENYEGKELSSHFPRAFLVPNTTYYFQMRDIELTDGGNYELQINLQNPKTHLYDKTDVTVLSKTDCPNKLKYNYPEIYYIEHTGKHSARQVFADDIIELKSPTNLTFIVNLPGGEPSIKCVISKNDVQVYNCSGIKEKDFNCELNIEISAVGTYPIGVTLTYIGYDPSTTKYFVQIPEAEAPVRHWFFVYALIGVLVVCFLIVVVVVTCHLIWRKRTNKGGVQMEMELLSDSIEDRIKENITTNRNAGEEKVTLGKVSKSEKEPVRSTTDPPVDESISNKSSGKKHSKEKDARSSGKGEDNTRITTGTSLNQSSKETELNAAKVPLFKNADVNADVNVETNLHEAAYKGRLAEVKRLCKQGSSLFAVNKNGCTPLGSACCNGHLDVAEFLIGYGADINFPGKKGNPPLHVAANTGQKKVVEFLCKKGANQRLINKAYTTPLGMAASKGNIGLVVCLIDHGSDINFPGVIGYPPLHCAVKKRHGTVVKYLLKQGAISDAKDKDKKTPLEIANGCNFIEIQELIIETAF